MILIFNQFNPEVGKYQIPVEILYKSKMRWGWAAMVCFPNGNTTWMDLESIERFAIRKINWRKVKTAG